MFKKSFNIPAAKPSSFTSNQIISDILQITREEEKHTREFKKQKFSNDQPLFDIKNYIKSSNDLIDVLEVGTSKRDELMRLRKDLENDVQLIKQKANDALEC